MACKHLNRIGDNYGQTCADCGQTLEGYGYWAESVPASCRHSFSPAYPGAPYEVCVYCEATRPSETTEGTR